MLHRYFLSIANHVLYGSKLQMFILCQNHQKINELSYMKIFSKFPISLILSYHNKSYIIIFSFQVMCKSSFPKIDTYYYWFRCSESHLLQQIHSFFFFFFFFLQQKCCLTSLFAMDNITKEVFLVDQEYSFHQQVIM